MSIETKYIKTQNHLNRQFVVIYLILIFIFVLLIIYPLFEFKQSITDITKIALTENKIDTYTYVPPDIYDSSGKLLATKTIKYELIEDITTFDETTKSKLSEYQSKEDKTYFKDIPTELMVDIKKKYPKTTFIIKPKRVYKVDDLLHPLGYWRENGSTGIEAYINKTYKNIKELDITIDYEKQSSILPYVYEVEKKVKTPSAVVGVMDLKNDEIIISISTPTVKPQVFVEGISAENYKKISEEKSLPLLDKFSDSQYPTGSIMKILTAYSALTNKKIDDKTIINSEGRMQLPDGTYLKEFTGLPYGDLNIYTALGKSSNIFFCKLFRDNNLTIDEFNNTQRLFGLGKKIGLEKLNEVTGIIPSSKYKLDNYNQSWYLGDSCNASIGQGFTAISPAQMLKAVSIVAKGKNVSPHYIKRYMDQNGDIVEAKYATTDIELDIPTLDKVKIGMKRAAELYSLQDVGIKTGTAETGIDNKDTPHSWVIGYYPYQKPKYSFVILLVNGGISREAVDLLKDILPYLPKD